MGKCVRLGLHVCINVCVCLCPSLCTFMYIYVYLYLLCRYSHLSVCKRVCFYLFEFVILSACGLKVMKSYIFAF